MNSEYAERLADELERVGVLWDPLIHRRVFVRVGTRIPPSVVAQIRAMLRAARAACGPESAKPRAAVA